MPRTSPFVRNPAEALNAILLCVIFVAASAFFFRDGSAADFRALWLAGQFYAQGEVDLVYPKDTTFFSMLPPPEWIEQLLAEKFSGEVYPFIYPPIWAWIAAQMTRLTSFETLMDWVVVINPILIVIMLIAARNLAAPTMRLWVFLAVGLMVLLLTPVGLVAFLQSQPQILVACLTVVAVDRAEHGAPRLAGTLLAVAAAIKLYPAFYMLFWLASGRRQASVSFLAAGAFLALASVGLTGWPLHAQFLHMVRLISDTVLVTRQSFALETLVAQICCFDQLQLIDAPVTDPLEKIGQGWYVLIKSPAFSVTFKLAQLCAVGWLFVMFRRSRSTEERAALWPLAFALLSLLGPIAWSYHFLSSVAFCPMLLVRFRTTAGLAILAVFVLVMSSVANSFFADAIAKVYLVQVAGTVSAAGLALAFFMARRASEDHSQNGEQAAS